MAPVALGLVWGCSGAQFRLDPKLRATAPMRMVGQRGFNAESCKPHTESEPYGIDALRAVAVSVGPLHGTLNAPHRAIASRKLASEKVRADFEPVLTDLRMIGRVIPDAARVAHAIDALLDLPVSHLETTVFTYVATVDERRLLSSCVATNAATTFGALDDPRFRLFCRMLSTDDGTLRTFEVDGYGNWADYRFKGTLRGDADREPLTFNSQTVKVFGVGAIRGFDVRRADGAQIAALDFQGEKTPKDEQSGPTEEYRALAWALPLTSRSQHDAVLSVLGLAFAYPWPSGCDADRIRRQGTEAAEEERR